MEIKAFLKDVSIFGDLSEEDYRLLVKGHKKKSVKADEDVFTSGKKSTHLYILLEGLVKLYNKSKIGEKEEIVCVIREKEFFCLAPVLTGAINHINARALQKTKLILIPAETINELTGKSHIFAQRIIQFLAHKESSLCKEVCSLSLSNTKERLAKYILAEYERSPQSKKIKLPLNQKQLASYLGTVREVISRDLAGFKKAKLIDSYKGKITLLDKDGLQKIAKGFSKRV